MAQQTVEPQTRERIDRSLNYLFDQWAGVPWWAEMWPEMDGVQREVFHLEWCGITEQRWSEMQRWAEQDLLTPEQRDRYASLSHLVAEQRPLLQSLLEDESDPAQSAPLSRPEA
jgi:hypothetical protein